MTTEMKAKLEVILLKLKLIKGEVDGIKPFIEDVRSYFKHQGKDEASASESLVVNFEYLDASHCIDLVEELEGYVEEEE